MDEWSLTTGGRTWRFDERPLYAERDRERDHCDFTLESLHEPPFIQNAVIWDVTVAMCAALHHLMKMAANSSDTDSDDILAFNLFKRRRRKRRYSSSQ